MKQFTRALAGVLAVVVIALGVFSVLGNTVLADVPFIQSMKNSAANAVIDSTGVKGKLDSALRSNASSIASATGLSESQVNGAIDQLNIQSWSVTSLPSNAQRTGSFSTNYGGTQATVTTYSDPSYVTVNAAGQDVTLSVPSSARSYVGYLGYLK